ncbi:MAG: hypothetical protein ACO1OB_11275 [Archangium sp.]
MSLALQLDFASAPPSRFHVDVAAAAPASRARVLCIGQRLTPRVTKALAMSGCELRTTTLNDALECLHQHAWRVILIAPTIDVEGDGVRFVRTFKSETRFIGVPAQLAALPSRYVDTPFVVLPLSGDTQFAVFTRPGRWSLGNLEHFDLREVVLTLLRTRTH